MLAQPLVSDRKKQKHTRYEKIIFMLVISLANGVLYGLSIPLAGGENVKKFLKIQDSSHANEVVYGLSGGAAICYTMFFYKTLESASFKFTEKSQLLFTLFAPLAACGYLTGGVEGSKFSGLSNIAGGVGVFLYLFRIISCVDASFKFPSRVKEIKRSWLEAAKRNDRSEKIRLILTVLFSVGYAAASTDAIYSAVKILLGWLDVSENKASLMGYLFGSVGAVGIFPLTLYWISRGLRQLTGGGMVDGAGNNPDPTDRWTYIALILVIPNILGVVGAAASEQAKIFGRLGVFAEAVRFGSSIVYATTSGTPGVSTLFRSIAARCGREHRVAPRELRSQYGAV